MCRSEIPFLVKWSFEIRLALMINRQGCTVGLFGTAVAKLGSHHLDASLTSRCIASPRYQPSTDTYSTVEIATCRSRKVPPMLHINSSPTPTTHEQYCISPRKLAEILPGKHNFILNRYLCKQYSASLKARDGKKQPPNKMRILILL